MASKFKPPDLSNATPEMLVDEMGKLSVLENYVKKLRKFYREALYARVGYVAEEFLNGEARMQNGETFVGTTSRSDPERISTKLLQENYPDIAVECTVSAPQLMTRFTLKEGVTNPIVNDLLEQMKKELDLE